MTSSQLACWSNGLERCTVVVEVSVRILASLNFLGFLFATVYVSALIVKIFFTFFFSSLRGSNKMEFIYSCSEKSAFGYVCYICLFIYFRFLSRHGFETNKLLNEMESQKELLLTYERTLSHKDSIVANVTTAIQKQVSLLIEGSMSPLHKKPFPFHIPYVMGFTLR